MATTSNESRALVFSDGSSNKFWKIELEGSSHTVNFGRVGTNGQTQTKEFDSDEDAKKSYDKLVAAKLKKGYADSGDEATTSTATKKATAAKTSKKATQTTAAKSTAQSAAKKSSDKKAAGTAEPPTEAASPATELPVDTSVTRVIDLDPEDWLRASFRPRKKLTRGEPAPFDKAACVQQLAKLKTKTYGWETRWELLNLPAALSPEEAHFWLLATTTSRGRDTKLKAFAEEIAKKKLTGQVDLEQARKIIGKVERNIDDVTSLALSNLLSADDYLSLLLEEIPSASHYWTQSAHFRELLAGFNKYVMPYLADAQLEAIRKQIRKNWDPHQFPAADYEIFPREYYLAAAVGMPDELYQVTTHWADNRYQGNEYMAFHQSPHEIVLGLGSGELIATEWRRLHLAVRSSDDVRAFLACTEFAALDCIADTIVAQTNKEDCEPLLQAFTLVRAPEAAEPMLRCKLDSKTPNIARDWLDANVGNAVTGLIETAGGRGKLAEAAIEYLRDVKRRGQESLIAEAVKKAGKSDAAAKVKAEVLDREEKTYQPLTAKTTPKWLAQALDSVELGKAKPLPLWAAPTLLPPLVIGDFRLNEEQLEVVLQLLMATPVTDRHPLFAGLREHASAAVRDEFAWKLFQLWLEGGYPTKEKWAMGTIGHLGDDGCVLKLTPMVRVWPGESQHARAVFGLECLRAIGSGTALMQLSGIAQKLKFKGLKGKAQQFVEEIASERGMTRDELEDRVIPDCGLEENGRREFSFGPRSFSFVLGGDLKAMIRDESGKIRPNLPNPGVKDDQKQATQSVAEWKLIKKQIKEVATIQAGRLEQAMVTGRRWNVADFETLLVRHPLMTHLAQKLIWAGFDAKGKRLCLFRVTEERDYADSEDSATKLDKVAAVGVAHALELTDAELSRWGEVMSDYEIVSPFPQLGRAVYALESGEGKTDQLARFHELKLVAPTLVFTLEKLGWTRGVAMDAGCFDEHSKQFPAADITAVVGYDGSVGMGFIDPDEMLTIKAVHFCSGQRAPSCYDWNLEKRLKLDKVPPIVLSEVIADLQVIKSKAK